MVHGLVKVCPLPIHSNQRKPQFTITYKNVDIISCQGISLSGYMISFKPDKGFCSNCCCNYTKNTVLEYSFHELLSDANRSIKVLSRTVHNNYHVLGTCKSTIISVYLWMFMAA
jgi:hypothetical protein